MSETRSLRRIWYLSLIVSVATVAGVFAYFNIVNRHGGLPLGYDSYYYVGWINQVVSSGPLKFAASQHYVEFLYPIVASVPVYLGASADTVEIVLPAVLACVSVVALGVLASEAEDRRFAILAVSFSGGWFAIFRMGADFHANLLALPLLLLATTLLVRVARDNFASLRTIGTFIFLVVVAGAAHIETTDFFLTTWFLAFGILGWVFSTVSWKRASYLIVASALATSPLTFAYFRGASAGIGVQYCVSPQYWLEVFGPIMGFAVLGIGVAAWRSRSPESTGTFPRLLFIWSMLAVGIGVLGYVSQFPIVLSDRSLLLIPLPLVASSGSMWLGSHVHTGQSLSQTSLLAVLVVVIPLLTAPLVFGYVAPHFGYFAEHGPSFVTCSSS